ncbi:MAG TPA: MBL fold metallo-hydrolase, partial [Anaerolineales bacterium]|nr:MBL fold metallo-hydrolase [Anaerolineales bacterium]
VFDAPGEKYDSGLTKLTAPSVSIESIGKIDAVLLSHDHHEDNLDKAGRAFLPKAKRVLTTTSGEKRLHGNAEGMADWQSTTLESGDTKIKITATPAQHGNLIARPFAGQTIGFMLEWEGQQNGAFYITGDTIYYRGIDQVAERFKISVAMFHLGRASFPITGPIRFTMDAKDGVRAAQKLNSRTIIPIHYEGWKHFVQGREAIEKEFAAAGLKLKLHWLNLGEPTEMAV